jgi:hypothetical protein
MADMKPRHWIVRLLALCAAGICIDSDTTAATLDRFYRMGEDAAEGATAGAAVSITRDSQGVAGQAQLIHLEAENTPTYRAITGRPDGGTGLGIEFNAADQEYLRGPNLGDPSVSVSAVHPDATLNYNSLFDRGLQFWVRPASSAVQSLVMDTNQHGVRIDSTGRFSMRYAGTDYASTVPVVPNTWYHVEVVRPLGAAGGSRLYVDGIAVAAAAGDYNADTADLVVGSNTAGDETSFTGGTEEFFSGVIDDLKMFVIGQAAATTDPPRPAADYGLFNPAIDNDFIASPLTGIKGVAGDVTNDGLLNQADKDAFIAGWLDRRVVNGIQVGDLISRAQGDLNLDGITNLHDLVLLQGALPAAGLAAITAAELQAAVPEPATAMLLLSAALNLALLRSRRSPRSRVACSTAARGLALIGKRQPEQFICRSDRQPCHTAARHADEFAARKPETAWSPCR